MSVVFKKTLATSKTVLKNTGIKTGEKTTKKARTKIMLKPCISLIKFMRAKYAL
tara:strand:+ start:370 stop:531 length:162 start_codon:yes stop_codon:yes gene_type:complete